MRNDAGRLALLLFCLPAWPNHLKSEYVDKNEIGQVRRKVCGYAQVRFALFQETLKMIDKLIYFSTNTGYF